MNIDLYRICVFKKKSHFMYNPWHVLEIISLVQMVVLWVNWSVYWSDEDIHSLLKSHTMIKYFGSLRVQWPVICLIWTTELSPLIFGSNHYVCGPRQISLASATSDYECDLSKMWWWNPNCCCAKETESHTDCLVDLHILCGWVVVLGIQYWWRPVGCVLLMWCQVCKPPHTLM